MEGYENAGATQAIFGSKLFAPRSNRYSTRAAANQWTTVVVQLPIVAADVATKQRGCFLHGFEQPFRGRDNNVSLGLYHHNG